MEIFAFLFAIPILILSLVIFYVVRTISTLKFQKEPSTRSHRSSIA